jgi:hypothetical protein
MFESTYSSYSLYGCDKSNSKCIDGNLLAVVNNLSRSQWPHGLRRRFCDRSPAEIVSWNPTGAWLFVCFECCVLSGRGLCDELITHPEESY